MGKIVSGFFEFLIKNEKIWEIYSEYMFSESRNPKTLRQILTQYCTPTEDLIRDFERACTLVPLEKGKSIVEQGKVCDVIVINRVGLFRVTHMEGGNEDTLLFGTSGDVFTSMHSYYAGEPSIFSLVAVEDSEAWVIHSGLCLTIP